MVNNKLNLGRCAGGVSHFFTFSLSHPSTFYLFTLSLFTFSMLQLSPFLRPFTTQYVLKFVYHVGIFFGHVVFFVHFLTQVV
nr:MAG TPA: hypothetical protein [Caudoviricetes sp.]